MTNQNDILPGVVVIAQTESLALYDVANGPDWSEGEPGRYSVAAIGSADYADDGLAAEFDSIADAFAAYPALALAKLDAWDSENKAAPRPCPDYGGWIADCRADLANNLADVAAFAEHMAEADAEDSDSPAVNASTGA